MAIERNASSWLCARGPESDIVISSRIRLARNVRGHRFRAKLDEARQAALEEELAAAIRASSFEEEIVYSNLADYGDVDRRMLLERHLISREHAVADGSRGVAVTRSESASIMTLEEDHLRIQVMRSGMDLGGCFEAIDRMDDELESRVDYAFDPKLGYLTACPTNVGTGMRVSVMLHLPGLVLTREHERMFHAAQEVSLVVRGLYGENSRPSGDFFQVSNQVTLGVTEHRIIAQLDAFVPRILEYERRVRDRLLGQERTRLEERVGKARDRLTRAETISSEEAMEELSFVRLGVNVGLVQDLEIGVLNSIFVNAQPAHIMKRAGKPLDAEERDVARARYIQDAMGLN